MKNEKRCIRRYFLKSFKSGVLGYTLIEILVVISIISLVMVTALYAINNAKMNSRDARRLSDIKTIQKAVELYYHNNNIYPGEIDELYTNDLCRVVESEPPGVFWPLISDILSASYISHIPDDPINNIYIPSNGCYWYELLNNKQGYILLMNPENNDILDEDMGCYNHLSYYCIGENWD